MVTLERGKWYNVDSLVFAGWTEGDGSGAVGYNVRDFFSSDGYYLGADGAGIEPLFRVTEEENVNGYVTYPDFIASHDLEKAKEHALALSRENPGEAVHVEDVDSQKTLARYMAGKEVR